MSVINVHKACKRYGCNLEKSVLNGFNMNVLKGKIYSLMGASGCGKTTLINSIVGINNLDSGDIEVFGEPPRKNRSRIGYMPQETALVSEFTIREMIWFYGTIFGLDAEMINEKLTFLTNLLELPDESRFIRDCSGGQQRRVSFAVTLIHEPDLLILDEPTVGVDPLLRTKIWDYLVELTVTNNVTVLLSTHYIEEARQSNYVGLMRNGILVAEDSPLNVLQIMESSNLEEAFLKLSQIQESDIVNQNSMKSFDHNNKMKRTMFVPSTSSWTTADSSREKIPLKLSAMRIFKALLIKNFMLVFRNADIFVSAAFVPIIVCICLHFGVGGIITGLKFGIVNDEVASYEQCLSHNRSLVTKITDFECILNKASCEFIKNIEDEFAHKVHFKSFDDAFKAAANGKIVGIIHFSSNYTFSLTSFNNVKDLNDSGIVKVYLDQTDFQKSLFIKRKLYETFQSFSQQLMRACNSSEKAGNIPIIFEGLYGELNFNMRGTLIPGFIFGTCFCIASFVSAMGIISERVSGTWNRLITAGVKPYHFLFSHLVEGSSILMIQFIEFDIYIIFFLLTNRTLGSVLLVSMLTLWSSFTGLTIGILFSIIMKSPMASLMFTQFSVYPVTFISGIAWPLEGMPIAFQRLAYLFPFAMPVKAFRSIIVKESGFNDPAVYLAFTVLSCWVVGPLLLSFWLLKEKPLRKNQPIIQ